MFNANNSSMKGTCNTYGQCLLRFNLRIIQEFSALNRQKNKNIQPGPEKQHSYIKQGVNFSDINVKEKKFKRNQSFFQILELNIFYELSKYFQGNPTGNFEKKT